MDRPPTDREYGLRIDCARNGCPEPHEEDGTVLPRTSFSAHTERVNGHAVAFVVRDVARSSWRAASADPDADRSFFDESPHEAVMRMLADHDGMNPHEGTCRGCGANLGVAGNSGATWPEVAAALHRHQWAVMGFAASTSERAEA